jgi:radical SAM modification target selenobiotic family peptide
MEKSYLQKVLAGIGIAGLLTGAPATAPVLAAGASG